MGLLNAVERASQDGTDGDGLGVSVGAAAVDQRPRRSPTAGRVLRALVSLAVIVVLFTVAIPRLAGGYAAVWELLRTISVLDLALLSAVWLVGLWIYAYAIQLCLPGMRHVQGIVVNAAGSAVSNMLPLGGAAGVATTYGMTMSWGFTPSAISAMILATGLFNFFATLLLPILALALLTVEGRASWQLAIPAAAGAVVFVLGVLFLGLIERRESTAERIGDVAQRVAGRVARRARLRAVPQWKQSLLDFRAQTSRIVRDRWKPMGATLVAYKLVQYVLLLLCVHVVDPGTSLTWIDVFAAFAFGRILASVPITPAGVGVVETGSIAALVTLGANQTAAAAAVLLFSAFVYVCEIPLGGAAWVLWATKRTWRVERPKAGRPDPTAPDADATDADTADTADAS